MPSSPLTKIVRGGAVLADGTLAIGQNTLSDWLSLIDGLPGDDLDEWSPEYIRRTLPVLGPLFKKYFRAEVRGLERIPAEGPVLLVGNHSGGTMIVDTFAQPIDLVKRFGRSPDPEHVYDELTADMQRRLTALEEERTVPVLG